MTIANTPMPLSKKSQDAVIEFYRQSYQLVNQQWNYREQLRQADLAYNRELDWTYNNQAAILKNRLLDADKMRNIIVPVVLPAVESAVTYQASVFLTGNPIFPVVSDPLHEDQAIQLETVLDNQAVRGAWRRELMMIFRDSFKYNLYALEVDWADEVTWAIETDTGYRNGLEGKPKEVVWSGNKIRRCDLYNTFFDSRCIPAEIHQKGEFAGYTEPMSRIELQQYIKSLGDSVIRESIKPAFESGAMNLGAGISTGGIESFYIPQINPDALINKNTYATTDWSAWAGIADRLDGNSASPGGKGIAYKNMFNVTKLYGRIMPGDFGIRAPNAYTPQIWKFVIVNQQVVLYCERMTNAHGYLPMLFGQGYEDGMRYQTKSMCDNVKPMQAVASSLLNAVIAGNRRAITDRVIYDPSRISEGNINNDNPSAKIPVKPSAYGKPLEQAVYAFPYNNSQSAFSLQQIPQVMGLSQQITGQNPARQGQFVKGNKSVHEFDTVMNNANGRDQMVAIGLEEVLFNPLKYMLKINVMQYQGGTQLYSRSKQKTVTIDPVALRTAVLEYQVGDGLTPTDKLINADTFGTAMQYLSSNPAIGAAFNIAPMFGYLMKTQGADISPFEKPPEQIAYEQAMQQYQQMCLQIVKELPKDGTGKAQFPPAPQPQQFGYNPSQNTGASTETAQANPSTPAAQNPVALQILGNNTSQPAAPTNGAAH